ncbi:MAG: hypothetical protein UJ210_00025 [Massilimicrobiota sp.]|nr:hypothetical protein [Massilimicrobiota sp.]
MTQIKYLIKLLLLTDFRIKMYIKFITNKNNDVILLKKFCSKQLRKKYCIIIKHNTIIGNNLIMPHPQNIIIGLYCRIGNNCTIYQDVTIGQNKNKYPTIGNNVIIYAGAKIIGDVHVGDNAIIGANAVVTKDIPLNAIVGGIPAKVIKYRSNDDEFY